MSKESVCCDLEDNLTRYAHNDLHGEDLSVVAQHLHECPSCRNYVEFVQDFFSAGTRPQSVTGSCPETRLLVAVESNELDKRSTEHVFAHILQCDACRTEYIFLRRASQAAITQHIPGTELGGLGKHVKPHIRALMARIGSRIVELAKHYAPETIIGNVRILPQRTYFACESALAGIMSLDEASQSFEITVGYFVYKIVVGTRTDHELWLNLTGATEQAIPLTISMYSPTGKLLLSAETDADGQASFTVAHPPSDLVVVRLHSQSAEEWIVIKIPT